ncbi:MAG: PHP domain-containing protein [Anaerolineae bacterium]|nr:PHP domain-containing protein [Anaerolineae bacterium]MDW8069326.1 PHP domain-containing protein [Anaerolineae bacterium]
MLSQQNCVDLHVHTTASDGSLTPTEVVRLALAQGLRAIALTDHDSVAGVAEAQAAARGTDLEVIPGVEISSDWPVGDFHILGLYIEPRNGPLGERLAAMRAARVGRARKMLERLTALGMPLEWEEVLPSVNGCAIGRLHIARAMLRRGYIRSLQEAFQYIGRYGPAYVPRLRITPVEAIGLIRQAGGVAVLAHPTASGVAEHIPTLASLGLQGIEVFYPEHSFENIKALLRLARQYRLLVTGGSDFHGFEPGMGAPLGSCGVPARRLPFLRQAAMAGRSSEWACLPL